MPVPCQQHHFQPIQTHLCLLLFPLRKTQHILIQYQCLPFIRADIQAVVDASSMSATGLSTHSDPRLLTIVSTPENIAHTDRIPVSTVHQSRDSGRNVIPTVVDASSMSATGLSTHSDPPLLTVVSTLQNIAHTDRIPVSSVHQSTYSGSNVIPTVVDASSMSAIALSTHSHPPLLTVVSIPQNIAHTHPIPVSSVHQSTDSGSNMIPTLVDASSMSATGLSTHSDPPLLTVVSTPENIAHTDPIPVSSVSQIKDSGNNATVLDARHTAKSSMSATALPTHSDRPPLTAVSIQQTTSTAISSQVLSFEGVHEESFIDINAHDVLQGEIDIRVMDYVTQMIKVQFHCVEGMVPPSYLYSLANAITKHSTTKIPSTTNSVQIHYIPGHYVVSAQLQRQLYIYDTLPNYEHIHSVQGQLKLLYEVVDTKQLKYIIPQSQGSTNLCGFFCIANAYNLLNNVEPKTVLLDLHQMRLHLRECLQNGVITSFPTTSTSFLRKKNIPPAVTKPVQQTTEGVVEIGQVQPINRTEHSKLSKQKHGHNPEYRLIAVNNQRQKQSDSTYKQKEMQRKRLKRTDPTYKTNELKQKRHKRSHPAYKERELQQKRRKRSDPAYKESELKQKRRKRSDPAYKESELQQKRHKRSDSTYKESELQQKRRKRSDPAYKESELQQKRHKRSDCTYKESELQQKRHTRSDRAYKESQLKHKRHKRSDPAYKESELKQKRRKRSDPAYKESELQQKRHKRSDYTYKESELQQKRRKRSDPAYKESELQQKRHKRSDSTYKESELQQKRHTRSDRAYKESQLKHKRHKRSDPAYKESELKQKRRKRSDPAYKESELQQKRHTRSDRAYKESQLKHKRHKRSDPAYKESELEQKRCKRTDAVYRSRERESDRNRKQNTDTYIDTTNEDMEKLITSFQQVIQQQCEYICTCCNQLWFKESVKKAQNVKFSDASLKKYCILGTNSVDDCEWICRTCANSLKSNKIPTLSLANGFVFPPKPNELCLNKLEERLVSPVNVFLQVTELPSGKQQSIHGNVVNVPCDNISTITSLPRLPCDTNTLAVKLKRRLRYKSYVLYENVRPHMCMNAVILLLNKSLYQQYVPDGINYNWLTNYTNGVPPQDFVNVNEPLNRTHSPNAAHTTDSIKLDSVSEATSNSDVQCNQSSSIQVQDTAAESDWSEDDDCPNNTPLGSSDTLLYPSSFDEYDGQHSYSVAPSEGNQPISIFQEHLEELAFPTLFCGETRPANKDRKVPVKYSEICKQELRNKDRRVALNVTNLFFKLKKLQIKHIQDKVWLSMKRCKTKGRTFTAADFKHGNAAEEIAKLDDGYKIFRCLRGSPPYWEAAKKDIFAMIRQLGIPTWFFSLSAAETRWTSLLSTLAFLIDGKRFSPEQMLTATWETKCRLIRSDPVTCARHFQHRVERFYHHILKNSASPLGILNDSFYRIEFQQRGSPHVHGLLWIEGAPHIGEEDDATVEAYISAHLSTAKHGQCDDDLIKLQCHRHSHSCRKNKAKSCRFNFPHPPMKDTKILQPFRDMTDPSFQSAKQDYIKIQSYLDGISTGSNMTYDQFLEALQLSEEQYILAIRTSIKDTKVFHKRDPDAVRVNAYNYYILKAWEANCDLQFITNPFSCAVYIVGYISKGQKGMSDFLRHVCEDAKKDGATIRNVVRTIGNKFSRKVEISAQEASYLVLQMPLRKSSRGFVFINTSPVEERLFLLKSSDAIDILDDDSQDIQCENIITRYTKRPNTSKSLCLADFASMYDISRFPKKRKLTNIATLELPESDMDDNIDDDLETEKSTENLHLKLTDGTVMRKRYQQKVIRYVRYSQQKDAENFYREQVMLFSPWFEENRIIGQCDTYEERYAEVAEAVQQKRQEYEHNAGDIDMAEEIVGELDEEAWDEVAPVTQHQQRADTLKKHAQDGDEHEDLFRDYDIGMDIGLTGGTDVHEELIKNRMEDEEFRSLVRSFNSEQTEIFYHVLKIAKTSEEQQFIFLSGGAGVGKTRVTKAMYQALVRVLNTSTDILPEQTTVLMTAPTGKAAYLIKGQTLHSAFSIPANQGFSYRMLHLAKLNSLRCKYSVLKWLFIDEVSMCGSNAFNYINNRLQEIMGSHLPFGGVNVIAIGDLYQLNPVLDKWIFEQPSADYNILGANIWVDKFRMFELTKIMRQRGDLQFSQALNAMREGLHTEAHIQLLKDRQIEIDTSDYPHTATHLMYRNVDVDTHNNNIYREVNTLKVEIDAVDIVIGDVSTDVAEQIKNKAPVRAGDSMGLAKHFFTAVSLKHEMTLNVDVDDGLVNGAACITKKMQFSNIRNKPEVIWVLFDDTSIGSKLRNENKHMYSNDIEKLWTPVKQVSREFPVGRYKHAKIRRTQFPLQLSCAKTVHRAQGDTLTQVVVKLPQQKRMHLHYVAFSRVTSLSNLYILGGFDESKITVSSKVQNEMNRLRTSQQIELSFKPLYSFDDKYLKICFHNCQSLHLHIMDVLADFSFSYAHITTLVETKLCSHDDNMKYNSMPDYQLVRNDFSPKRSAYGSSVYKHNTVSCTIVPRNYGRIEFTVCKFLSHIPQLQLISVYIRPNESIQYIRKAFEHLAACLDVAQPLVIIGDFNINALYTSNRYSTLTTILQPLSCRQIVDEYTTNGRTCIDLIFTNIDQTNYVHGTLESYYSYHKPVYMCIQKKQHLLAA